MASRVGERGQITLEKRIREELGVCAGDQAIQRVENGRIVVEIMPGRHRRSAAGILREKVKTWPPSEDWETLREAADSEPDPDRRPRARKPRPKAAAVRRRPRR
jgi:bifunctional DNA-binding transcriptional regulator/antitoxin component of YhaV-PrlF toxin-antitoxin module